jgi:hypothetical protein
MTSTNGSEISASLPPLRARHALLVFGSPRRLFRRIEDTPAYGGAMAILLVLVALIGYAEVQTGLIDRVVQREIETQKAQIEKAQRDTVDRVALRKQLEDIDKAGSFATLMARIKAVAFDPVYFLASILVISSCLYALVALTGQKPEYHSLVSICVYAEFVELAAHLLRFLMMLAYRTITLDTSLGLLTTSTGWAWLSAIDPFRVWFWVLVAMGAIVTRQLSRRMAIVACSVMGLLAMATRGVLAYLGV